MAELVFGMSAVFALPRRLLALGLRMWTIHAAPWKGRGAVSSGGLRFPEGLRSARSMAAVSVRECVKQASVTSFDAMQPSGCRGVQHTAGHQIELASGRRSAGKSRMSCRKHLTAYTTAMPWRTHRFSSRENVTGRRQGGCGAAAGPRRQGDRDRALLAAQCSALKLSKYLLCSLSAGCQKATHQQRRSFCE
eukprot:scaffold27325_cov243-Isochrysis_galbana.AAC.1